MPNNYAVRLMLTISIALFPSITFVVAKEGRSGEYFYCGYTNIDGTGQDYAAFEKGSDLKYNENADRWEW